MDEWALVLAATGIVFRVEPDGSGWRLVVARGDDEAARAALEAYDRESHMEDHAVPAASSPYQETMLGIVVAVLLAACYRVSGPARPGNPRFDAGAASAAKIAAGEVWRTVTALTLHANPAHILGNVVAAAVFVTAVGRLVGPGVAAWLVLLAGAGGNAVNAVLRGAPHQSVGASTAIFGAIGILGGLGFARPREHPGPRRRVWIPGAGSLALLAMLGAGEEADISAHLFGLVVGLPLGFAAARLAGRPPGRWVQGALAVAALAAVVGCWVVARGAAPAALRG
jgi:membrane associated rhomboid family serine protease